MSAESREILSDVLSDAPRDQPPAQDYAPPSTHIHQAADAVHQAQAHYAAQQQMIAQHNAAIAQQQAAAQYAHAQQQYQPSYEPAYNPYTDPTAYDPTLADPWSVREVSTLRGEISQYVNDVRNHALNVQEAHARAAYGDDIVDQAQRLALELGKGGHYAIAGYDKLCHDFAEVEMMRMGSSGDWLKRMAAEPVRPRRR